MQRPVLIGTLKLSTIKQGDYLVGRQLETPGAAGMGSDIDAAKQQIDTAEYGPPSSEIKSKSLTMLVRFV